MRFDVARRGAVLAVRATQDVALGALRLALHAAADVAHGVPLARAALALPPLPLYQRGNNQRAAMGTAGVRADITDASDRRPAHAARYALRAELSAGSYELRIAPQREPRAALPSEVGDRGRGTGSVGVGIRGWGYG